MYEKGIDPLKEEEKMEDDGWHAKRQRHDVKASGKKESEGWNN